MTTAAQRHAGEGRPTPVHGFQVEPDELRSAAARIADIVRQDPDQLPPAGRPDAFGHAGLAAAADNFRASLSLHSDQLTRDAHETATALRATAVGYETPDEVAAAVLTIPDAGAGND